MYFSAEPASLNAMHIIVVLESKTKLTSESASMTNTDHILIFIITFVENAEYYVGVLCVTTVKLNPFVTRSCSVLTGFVVYRFKLHRHLVDESVKSVCFRQVSVYPGFALDKLHCITNAVQMNSKVIQLIFNNLITLRNCLWLTH